MAKDESSSSNKSLLERALTLHPTGNKRDVSEDEVELLSAFLHGEITHGQITRVLGDTLGDSSGARLRSWAWPIIVRLAYAGKVKIEP